MTMPIEPSFQMNESMIVVAGAGTGKTWRLVRRYLLAIAHDFPSCSAMNRVAAVTFTRAAAAEMRRRVAELVDELRAGKLDPQDPASQIDPSRLPDRASFAAALAAAPISTFHVLCAQLLREFGECINVSPLLTVIEPTAEEVEAARFVSAKTDEWLDDIASHPDFHALLAERSLTQVRSGLTSMACAPETLSNNPDEYLQLRLQVVEQLLTPFTETLELLLADYIREMDQLQASDPGRFAQSKVRLPETPHTALKLVAWANSLQLNDLHGNADSVKLAKNVIRDIKGALETLLPTGRIKLKTKALNNNQLDELHAAMRPWWNTSLKIACEFRDHLRKRGLITYNELERLTGQMLSEIARQPALSQQLRGRFTHLLVDEFQDTNQTQVNILNQLRLLCGEDVLRYYVGDAKQSIYRFRHADVNVFTQHIASPQNTDANTLQMVDLPRSRRFAPALADFFHVFFNRILPPTPHWPQQLPAQGDHIGERPFAKPETHALLDLDWHDHTTVLLQSPPADPVLVTTARSHGILFKGDKATPAEPAISLLNSSNEAEQEASEGESLNVDDNELLLEKDPTEEPNSDGDEPSEDKESPSVSRRARQKAARWLRQQFDGEGQFIRNADGKFRPVEPSDVAILVRSWNEANKWARTLAKAGIASQVHGGRGLRDVISACDLQNLLHFLNDSENNSAALGVLRGPLFGISDLGLYVLARWPGVVRLVGDEEKPWSDNETEELRKSARHLHSVARMARLNPEKAVQALLRAGVADPQQHDTLLSQLTHDAQRLEAGRNALQRVFWRVGREPVAALLRELVFTEHMEAHWRVLPDGEREIANAWRFIAQVESAEGAYPSLPRVIAWLNSDADPTPEGLLEPAGNSVAITTWHGAKGLEWNIVMLTHLNHSGQSEKEKWQFFSARDHNNQLVRVPIYKRQGPGFPETDDPFKTSALVDVVTAADEASETKRLLYVAMTRAREQVVFAGTVTFGMRGNSQTKLLTTTQITEITTQLNANNNKDALDKHVKENPLPAPLALCRQAGHYVAFALSLRPGSVPPSPIEGAWCAHLPFIAESTLKQVDQAADHDVTAWERETPQPLPATLWQGGDARTTLTPSRAGSLGLQLPVFSVEFAPPGKPLRNPPAATAALPIHADDADAPSDEAARQGWDHLAVGTLFHALAERWNFGGPAPGADTCTQWLEPLVPSDQAKTLGPWIAEALQRMTLTPLFDEWVEAAREGRLWHELAIDTLYGEHRITGRIDLLWRDAQGAWHLLDYKVTSKGTTESDVQELQSTYAKQLALYRAALAQQNITLASARLYLVLSGALIAAR